VNRLIERIPEIRLMTKLPPEVFCPRLISCLADCGIALVFLPHIGGSFLHGATFYDKNKIVIGLTVRGKDADRFWFSFFHELAHIILGHIGNVEGTTEEDEEAANAFARDTLIPKSEYDGFVSNNYFSKESMMFFANKIGIDVGIVVGRLQKDGVIQYNWHNDLKTKYEIA
jgi:HTH-type transcriptional regulator/antitoxin HigA